MFLSVDTLQVKQSHRLSYLLFPLYRSFASHPVFLVILWLGFGQLVFNESEENRATKTEISS